MTKKEKKIGAKLTKRINIAIFILALLCALATYIEEHREPTTAELDPSSPAYNEEKALQYNLNKTNNY